MEFCNQIDTSALVDIYADGWCAVDNLGTTFRTVFFVFAREPNGLLVQTAVASIIRPQSSVARNGRIAALLRVQEPPVHPPQWPIAGVICN